MSLYINGRKILDAAAQLGAAKVHDGLPDPTFSSFLTGTSGALHAVVEVYGSQDNVHWTLLGTLTMDVANWSTVSDDAIDTFWIKTAWAKLRCDVIELTGNGAAVSVHAGS